MNIQEWIEAGKPWNVILHGDCMELMEHIEDKSIELACVDPPYGINVGTKTMGKGSGNDVGRNKKKSWDDNIPDKNYFSELFRISQNQIIWGGNYMIQYLYNTPCFLLWDKKDYNSDFASHEMAWTSFKSPVKCFHRARSSNNDNKNKIHVTQKPIALYQWILNNYAKPGDKIIDTHSGSGSLACACHLENFDFLAIEKDEDYFKSSVERLETLRSQGRLFQ